MDNDQVDSQQPEDTKPCKSKQYLRYVLIGLFVIVAMVMMAKVSCKKPSMAIDACSDTSDTTSVSNEGMVGGNDAHEYDLYDEIEAFIAKQADYIASQ